MGPAPVPVPPPDLELAPRPNKFDKMFTDCGVAFLNGIASPFPLDPVLVLLFHDSSTGLG